MPWESATVSAAVIPDAFQYNVTVSIVRWEGAEKGGKSENLPLIKILQPAANGVHIIRYYLPHMGVVCCKIKQLLTI